MRVQSKSWIAVVVVLLGILLYFFHSDLASPGNYAQIYFPDKNEMFLVPISRSIMNPTPQSLLQELQKGPQDHQNLLPAFSSKELPVEVKASGSTIIVNFLQPPSLGKWPMVTKSLMATFKQLQRYDTVKFLVQGKPGIVIDGKEIGEESLHEFSPIENLDERFAYRNEHPTSEHPRSVTVFYFLKGTHYLIPVKRNVPFEVSLEEGIARVLEESNRFPDLVEPILPQGSHILSLSRPSDQAIDLTVELIGNKDERMRARKGLVLSFTSLPGVKSVRIREGKGILSWRPLQHAPSLINTEGVSR